MCEVLLIWRGKDVSNIFIYNELYLVVDVSKQTMQHNIYIQNITSMMGVFNYILFHNHIVMEVGYIISISGV